MRGKRAGRIAHHSKILMRFIYTQSLGFVFISFTFDFLMNGTWIVVTCSYSVAEDLNSMTSTAVVYEVWKILIVVTGISNSQLLIIV